MTLTDQIARERSTVNGYEKAIKDAREKLWDAKFVATHDARRHTPSGLEDEQHWHRRRRRNREAFENRDEAVEHLVRKMHAHEKMIDQLKDLKEELKDERRDSGKFDKGSTKIVTFDGKSCVEDIAYWLDVIRGKGMWSGVLVSGYRTPAYSQQLCYNICGNPSCPGRCAGLSSNHCKTTYPGPAADVTDYIRCENALIDVGSGYSNNLPYDLVHMSHSGG